jgi:hypothetical protein
LGAGERKDEPAPFASPSAVPARVAPYIACEGRGCVKAKSYGRSKFEAPLLFTPSTPASAV